MTNKEAIEIAKMDYKLFPEDNEYLVNCIEALNKAEKQDKFLEEIDNFIKCSDIDDEYTRGFRNGMRFCKSCFDGKSPNYE